MGVEQQIDNINEKLNWHWRNSMRIVRFLSFDGRAAITLPILLIYPRWSTIFLTIAVLVFFNALEKRGLTFPAALRLFRMQLVGNERPGLCGVYKRTMKDFG